VLLGDVGRGGEEVGRGREEGREEDGGEAVVEGESRLDAGTEERARERQRELVDVGREGFGRRGARDEAREVVDEGVEDLQGESQFSSYKELAHPLIL